MNGLWKLLALALVAVSLIAAGCGDDDDDDTSISTTTSAGATGTTGVAATKEQWIATADEVCANAEREITRALEQSGLTEDATPQEIAVLTESTVVPIQQTVIDTLRGLQPPEGEEEFISEILDQLQAALDTISGDRGLLSDPAAAEAEFDAVDAAAQEYGLQECGSE